MICQAAILITFHAYYKQSARTHIHNYYALYWEPIEKELMMIKSDLRSVGGFDYRYYMTRNLVAAARDP